jgi:hypothetical protein
MANRRQIEIGIPRLRQLVGAVVLLIGGLMLLGVLEAETTTIGLALVVIGAGFLT